MPRPKGVGAEASPGSPHTPRHQRNHDLIRHRRQAVCLSAPDVDYRFGFRGACGCSVAHG